MHCIVIGGTGHIGTYLVPRLIEAGAKVSVISRQQREPYQTNAAWKNVNQVTLDREALEHSGDFGNEIKALKPDVVIDLICFSPESNRHLIDALKGSIEQFLHCGTIWVHGPTVEAPSTEAAERKPFGDYGIKKAQIEKDLLKEARQNGFPASILHPGHIVGPGWNPLNPAGHFNNKAFETLAKGETLALANFGLETVHHVHADDVAQSFINAMQHWSNAVGESFHAVSSQALSLRGYAEKIAAHFGQKAKLEFLAWEDFKKTVSEQEAQTVWDHIMHSPNCSIAKAQSYIRYKPRYSSLEAVKEAVTWLVDKGEIQI